MGNIRKEYISNIVSTSNQINYLFVGDSHGSDNLDKNLLISSSYNLSRPSDNLKDIYCKLLYLTSKKTVIRNLIIEVDPQLFSNYRLLKNNNEMIVSYLDYNNYKNIFKVNLLEYYILKLPIISQKNRNFIFKGSLKKIIRMLETKSSHNHIIPKSISVKDNNVVLNKKEAKKRVTYHFSKGILDENEIKYYFYKIIE
jgi:hypothetical protein